jgi:hypothetical protein
MLDKQKCLDLLNGYEVDELLSIAHYASQLAKRETRKQFRIGATVSWNGKNGKKTGVVQKINQKSINVLVGEWDEWRVSPALLTLVEDVEPSRPRNQLVDKTDEVLDKLCRDEPQIPCP